MSFALHLQGQIIWKLSPAKQASQKDDLCVSLSQGAEHYPAHAETSRATAGRRNFHGVIYNIVGLGEVDRVCSLVS